MVPRNRSRSAQRLRRRSYGETRRASATAQAASSATALRSQTERGTLRASCQERCVAGSTFPFTSAPTEAAHGGASTSRHLPGPKTAGRKRPAPQQLGQRYTRNNQSAPAAAETARRRTSSRRLTQPGAGGNSPGRSPGTWAQLHPAQNGRPRGTAQNLVIRIVGAAVGAHDDITASSEVEMLRLRLRHGRLNIRPGRPPPQNGESPSSRPIQQKKPRSATRTADAALCHGETAASGLRRRARARPENGAQPIGAHLAQPAIWRNRTHGAKGSARHIGRAGNPHADFPQQRQPTNSVVGLADTGNSLLKHATAPTPTNNAELLEGLHNWKPLGPAQGPPHRRPSGESHTRMFLQLQLQRATEPTRDGAKLRNPTNATLHDPTGARLQVIDEVAEYHATHPRHHTMPAKLGKDMCI